MVNGKYLPQNERPFPRGDPDGARVYRDVVVPELETPRAAVAHDQARQAPVVMRLGVPFLSLVAAERVDPVVKNSVEPGNHGQTSIVGKVVQQIQHALAVRPGTKRNAVGFPGEVAKRGEGKGIGDGFGFGGCLFFRFFRFSCVPRFGVVFFVFYFRFFIISSSKPSKRPRVQIQVQVPPSSPLRAVGGENRVWWLAFFVAGAVLGICVAGAVLAYFAFLPPLLVIVPLMTEQFCTEWHAGTGVVITLQSNGAIAPECMAGWKQSPRAAAHGRRRTVIAPFLHGPGHHAGLQQCHQRSQLARLLS